MSKATKLEERFIYQDDEVMEKPFDWEVFRRLGSYIKPYYIKLIPVIIMTLLTTVSKLGIPLLIGIAIDEAIRGKDLQLLWMYGGAMFGLYILQWVANSLRIRMMNVIGHKVIYDMREALFKHIQKLSFRFFDQRPAGSILVRVTNDINSLQELLTNGLVNLVVDLVQLVGIIAILLLINVKLALAVMITVPIMFFISTTFRKAVRRSWQSVRMKQSRINAHLNESIQGIRVTQAYAQEKENIAYFDYMNESNRRSWDKAVALNTAFGPLIDITAGIGLCILFWYGSTIVQQGEGLTIGMLVSFATYIGNFWEPINRLGQMYSQLLIAMASCERIFEFMDEKPTVREDERAKTLPPVAGHVKLENIVFEYERGRPALKNVSLDVKAGQTIALVGHTGSGKKYDYELNLSIL